MSNEVHGRHGSPYERSCGGEDGPSSLTKWRKLLPCKNPSWCKWDLRYTGDLQVYHSLAWEHLYWKTGRLHSRHFIKLTCFPSSCLLRSCDPPEMDKRAF
ncbi:hypothetical protein SKAU_G00192930 [Synaphobranchus kaupii]|uniref:Uncharacterized protein n=1 Tax=Synaphobranchus kaupii TaxID=118154 RepID=A0A9Q1IWJ2_SYNKA|nr:hypothetical protein SKAU_G00192930 [Synaphobranchus kaupii]